VIRYRVKWTNPSNAVIVLTGLSDPETTTKALAYHLLQYKEVTSTAFQSNMVFVTARAPLCLECIVEEFFVSQGRLAISSHVL